MKIRIIDAYRMGVNCVYSNGDVVEVEYNVDDEEYRDTEKPFLYAEEWEGKYFEVIEQQPSEWSGNGIPPVGTVCEVSINNQEYREVEIVAYFDKTRSVIVYEAPWTPEIYEWDDCKFQPIKSEKQKEIEDMVKVMESFTKGDTKPELAEILYDAGLRFTKDSK